MAKTTGPQGADANVTDQKAVADAVPNKKKRGLKFFLIGVGVVFAALTFLMQGQRMLALRKENEALQILLLELKNDTQRLERMIQYSQTDAYIEQMAHKRLGWVLPGDILFCADAEPTPAPAGDPEQAEPDAEPTPAPEAEN